MSYLPTVFERAPGLNTEVTSLIYRLNRKVGVTALRVICSNESSSKYNGLAGVRLGTEMPKDLTNIPTLATYKFQMQDTHERVSHGVFRGQNIELPSFMLPQLELPEGANIDVDDSSGIAIVRFE